MALEVRGAMFSRRAVMMVLAVVSTVQFHAMQTRAQDVLLSTSRPCYAPGDTVSFTLSNQRSSSIFMPYSPAWDVFDATGFQVAPLIHFTVVIELPGETTVTYAWLQNDHDGNQVHSGAYRVEVAYSPQMNPWNPMLLSMAFVIDESCSATAAAPVPWSQIKGLYR
jgi:hypothetical protein